MNVELFIEEFEKENKNKMGSNDYKKEEEMKMEEMKMRETQNQNSAEMPKSQSRFDSPEPFQSFNQMAVSEKKEYHCPFCKKLLLGQTTQNGFLYEHSLLKIPDNSSYIRPNICINNGKYYYELRTEKRSN